ncbi:MAG: hypothetical protein JNM84_08845 [Planctomycetes bacterium]|nr:hypothetical protein [Planctomycetota bacterium]
MFKLVEDLFLTDTFLIKGRFEGKHGRLSQALDGWRRGFVPVVDATLVDVRTRERFETPRVSIAWRELILAHELIDTGSDHYRRHLVAERPRVPIRAFVAGRLPLELSGDVAPQAYDHGGLFQRCFILHQPRLRGLELEQHDELRCLAQMSYAIVMRERLSYVYDFSDLLEREANAGDAGRDDLGQGRVA